MNWVLGYDIRDKKRLRKVARLLERYGIRTQYSVFLYSGTVQQLEILLDELAKLMNLSEDVVQAWPLGGTPEGNYVRGSLPLNCPAAVILSQNQSVLVRPDEDHLKP